MAGAKPLRTLFTMISPELKILYLLHALAYSYAPGKLAVGSSPPLWRPRFCDNPQEGTWEGSKKTPMTRTTGVILSAGMGQGRGQALSPP
jgi:hypothetical protein